MAPPPVSYGYDAGIARITMKAGARHNCLTPAMVTGLHEGFDKAMRDGAELIVLSGEGPSFSSGGDVRAFLSHAEVGDLEDYARTLVGDLHAFILKMLDCDAPILAPLQGMVTGGALGLILASDLVVMADDAFLQPYYAQVGYSPDGGWTALLPECIGPRRALAIQLLNERISAAQACELGIAHALCPVAQLDAKIEAWVTRLQSMDQGSLASTKRLIWSTARRAEIARKLEAETENFVHLILRKDVEDRMRDFLSTLGKGKNELRSV